MLPFNCSLRPSNLAFESNALDPSAETQPLDYRHTKIIATLGPATQSLEKLTALIKNGVDVVRLNMAHGTVDWVREIVADVRKASRTADRAVAVMMDVKGPEIRTGALEAPVPLASGDRLWLVPPGCESSEVLPESSTLRVSVNYAHLARELTEDSTVLVDSGLMRWQVIETKDDCVLCEVAVGGELTSRRHINLPGVEVDLPALTEKDQRDLLAGIDAGIDFVALSFVRRADDIVTLRHFLCEHSSSARIVAKIEEQAGVRNMEEIISAADAVMVARGDLGIEIDFAELPIVQSRLIETCQREGKPVIVATHLLESMIHSPIPTRAEISDICSAVREQADAVMLSGETTTGKYPIESVQTMARIVESIEPTVSSKLNEDIQLHEPKSKMLRSSALLAQDLSQGVSERSGIVVFTRSGFLAYVLGALRPRGVPIFAFTDIEAVFHQLLLPWGVEPFLIDFSDDPEVTIATAFAALQKRNWCAPGAWLVVITNVLADDKVIDSLQLRQYGID